LTPLFRVDYTPFIARKADASSTQEGNHSRGFGSPGSFRRIPLDGEELAWQAGARRAAGKRRAGELTRANRSVGKSRAGVDDAQASG